MSFFKDCRQLFFIKKQQFISLKKQFFFNEILRHPINYFLSLSELFKSHIEILNAQEYIGISEGTEKHRLF